MLNLSATRTAALWVLLLGSASMVLAQDSPKVIRVGMIGLDTSHSVVFTRILNAENPLAGLAGCRVVVACPRGSADIESATSRIPGYTEDVKKLGVKIVDSVEAVVAECDAVLLETNDGRPHLEQIIPALKAGKPVFVDKPIAGSLADAVAIYQASRKFNAPVFSSSSLRYMKDAQQARAGELGTVLGCDTYSPCALESTHPSLYWYGIHGVEALFTVMGPDCESVSRISAKDFELAAGTWSGGRIGTFRGLRGGKSGYGGVVYTDKAIHTLGGSTGYEPLLVDIVKFFRTQEVPVTEEETLAIYAFMSAADESLKQGGAAVSLKSVLDQARKDAEHRLGKLLKQGD